MQMGNTSGMLCYRDLAPRGVFLLHFPPVPFNAHICIPQLHGCGFLCPSLPSSDWKLFLIFSYPIPAKMHYLYQVNKTLFINYDRTENN